MENEETKFKVGDKVYVRGDDVLHTVKDVVPMWGMIGDRWFRQETNYWVSDGLPFPHWESELTSVEEKIGTNKVVTDCIDAYVSKIAEEINKVAVENGFLKKELAEATTKADVYKRDAENLQRTLEEAGEEIKDLKSKVEDLEGQFAYECECNAQFVDCQNENERLKEEVGHLKTALAFEQGLTEEYEQSQVEYDRVARELKRELAELPKKICDEIREIADVNVDCFGYEWFELDADSLDEIEEKYTKG